LSETIFEVLLIYFEFHDVPVRWFLMPDGQQIF
jgi:hypothetical protein